MFLYTLEIEHGNFEWCINIVCGISECMKRFDDIRKSCSHFVSALEILDNANFCFCGYARGLAIIVFRWKLADFGMCENIQHDGCVFGCLACESRMT